MQYYAKTYTAEPKIGLITPGEFLTDEQAAILGEEKIADMVARDILGMAGKKASTPKPAESEEPVAPAEDADDDADTEEADEADDAEESAETEDGDELPELDAAGEIGEEEEKPAEKPAKKAGRRKTAK